MAKKTPDYHKDIIIQKNTIKQRGEIIMKMTTQALYEISQMVLKTAIVDYKSFYRKKVRNPQNSNINRELNTLRHFFKNNLYCDILDVDGVYLYEAVEKEIDRQESKTQAA